MDQLALQMIPKLRMDAAEFLIHAGVNLKLENVIRSVGTGRFSLFLLQGERLSGKTHALIWLHDRCLDAQLSVTFLQGKELSTFLDIEFQQESVSSSSIFLIDDADHYFCEQIPGSSAAFVNFYETVKRAGGQIVCMLTETPDSFSCDEHIMSRLNSAISQVIEPPSESEVFPLLTVLAKQRGLSLGERKNRYLETRVGRDIASMVAFLDRLQVEVAEKGKKASFPNLSEIL